MIFGGPITKSPPVTGVGVTALPADQELIVHNQLHASFGLLCVEQPTWNVITAAMRYVKSYRPAFFDHVRLMAFFLGQCLMKWWTHGWRKCMTRMLASFTLSLIGESMLPSSKMTAALLAGLGGRIWAPVKTRNGLKIHISHLRRTKQADPFPLRAVIPNHLIFPTIDAVKLNCVLEMGRHFRYSVCQEDAAPVH